MSIIKIANIQIKVSAKKEDNFATLNKYLEDIAKENVDLVVLPEMFNCPYQTFNFPIYAEEEEGESWQACSNLARAHNIYLVAGSMPEKDKDGKVYNTSYVFDRKGKQIGKHRKAHLFDIDIEGGQYFKESDTLTPGNQVTVFETEFGNIGLCICYDFRFPELSRLMVEKGAKIIVVPGAFNMTTGLLHWEILFRLRAVDNQVFTIGSAPARDPESGYTSWGHSMVVSPWGNIINEMDEKEGYIISELDLSLVEKARKELPLLAHRRHDMYTLEELK